MSGFLSRLAQLFSARAPKIEELPVEPKTDAAFSPIDSNVETMGWFNGGHVARRDSIDSNPDTARWYRKPRYVAPSAAAHRTSLVGGG